jgi:hypothetical protein
MSNGVCNFLHSTTGVIQQYEECYKYTLKDILNFSEIMKITF